MSNLSVRAGAIDESGLTALVVASATINGSLNLEEVLTQIARSAADVLDAEASSVLLFDRERNQLVFKAAVGGQAEALVGHAFDARLGIAGRVLASGEPELSLDARSHPDFYEGIDAKLSFHTKGMIAAPLTYRADVIGVVEVLNKRGEGHFGDRDIEILKVFANLAAISATNARMHESLKKDNLGFRKAAATTDPIVGSSKALAEALKLCDRVAATNATVLLLGETGTGKELSARRVHAHSPRSERAFIAINCAALPETLLESELFGHEAGAFTGATSTKLGRFELADQGTLFLDEIGDVSPSTQIKLLRVLQEREFVRVGGSKTITCDVRIIAATNRDLQKAMRDGEFREDLYYRLNVFPIHLPPLRERRDDIPLLVEYFAEKTATELGWLKPKISPKALELLCAYRWPGNIREMRNVMERSVLMCDSGIIEPQILPREFVPGTADEVDSDGVSALEGYEKAMIVRALEENGWNQTRAAESLNISRDNLRYRVRKYEIKKPE
jgi:Nif-specific regulatory protein